MEEGQAVASMVFEIYKYIYPLAFVVGAGCFARTSRDALDPVTTSEADGYLSMERGRERPLSAIQSYCCRSSQGSRSPVGVQAKGGEQSKRDIERDSCTH